MSMYSAIVEFTIITPKRIGTVYENMVIKLSSQRNPQKFSKEPESPKDVIQSHAGSFNFPGTFLKVLERPFLLNS